jgi:hypothetical protein
MENRKIRGATKVEVGETVFKSKLEARIAEAFQELGIEYEYEKYKITLLPSFDYDKEHFRSMIYTPDFKVGNAIIEAKGFPSDAWKIRKKIIMWTLKNIPELEYFEVHSIQELLDMVEQDDRFLTYNIQVFTLDNTFVGEYNSVTDAVNELNIKSNKSNIFSCIIGKRNKAGGYIWKRVSRVFIPDENEEWKDVIGFEGLYYVSNLGRVASAQFHGIRNFRLMSQFSDSLGYHFVKLRNWKKGIVMSAPVHRLVAEAFLPNPENKPQVDHIDTDPSNNNVENLRWATSLENQRNPLTLERLRSSIISMNKQGIGPKASAKKKRKRVVFTDGTSVTRYESISQASKATGLSTCSIQRWCNRQIKGWSYEQSEHTETDQGSGGNT